MSHILVIEDDKFFSELLVELLKQDGHVVSLATDGAKALQLLSTQRPDLIITDILMPNMDGVELIMALAKQDNRIPVIAMSGGRRSISPEFSLESAKLLGVKTTLTKPFTHTDLRQIVQSALA
jgi:CheY-like chemotaxis protein